MDQDVIKPTEPDDTTVTKPRGIFGGLFKPKDGDGASSGEQEESEGQNVDALVTEHKITKGSFIIQGNSVVIILFTQDGRQIQRTIQSDKSYVSFTLT